MAAVMATQAVPNSLARRPRRQRTVCAAQPGSEDSATARGADNAYKLPLVEAESFVGKAGAPVLVVEWMATFCRKCKARVCVLRA